MVRQRRSSIYDLAASPQYSPSTSPAPDDREPLCYFSYIPAAASDHWSLETPSASPCLSANIVSDPQNPFLAARSPLLSPPQTMEASKLLQLQTTAAHQLRPKPQPHQDVFELSDDSITSRRSSNSTSSTSSSSSYSQKRMCSRCQATYGEFVKFSVSSFYCKRCAKMTGLIPG